MSNSNRIDRIINEANFIVNNKGTIREAASVFKVSKSTIHKDMTKILPNIDSKLYIEVRKIFDINNSEKHIRGGEATKRKYSIMNWERFLY